VCWARGALNLQVHLIRRDEWSPNDKYGTNSTYQPILTVRILGTPQHVARTVGKNGRGVDDVVLDAGNGGVGVCGIMTDGRHCGICVYWKSLLEEGS